MRWQKGNTPVIICKYVYTVICYDIVNYLIENHSWSGGWAVSWRVSHLIVIMTPAGYYHACCLSGSLKCRSLIQLIHVLLTMERITNAINTFVITIYFFFNAFFFIQLYFLKALFMQLYASMGSRVDRKPLSSKDATLFFYCFFCFKSHFMIYDLNLTPRPSQITTST